MSKENKRILLLVVVLFLLGITGYSLIEDWSLLDSLYITVITLSTTGYKEVYPLSDAGKVFTMILIIFGITIFLYALREFNLLLFEGKFFQERKMQKKINQLENHYIICGYGRMGKKIAQELYKRKTPFVILEKELDSSKQLENYQYIAGDATEDENLIKAGANRVVLPYEIGGYRITQALLRPTVVDFIDEVFSRSDLGLGIEEVKIVEESKLVGKSIAESEIRSDFNTIIVGIYRSSGKLIYNPRSDTMIEKEDNLIVIGEIKKLDKLQEKANEK